MKYNREARENRGADRPGQGVATDADPAALGGILRALHRHLSARCSSARNSSAPTHGNKVLILMSDMIETILRMLRQMRGRPRRAEAPVELDSKRAIPDLRGVCVYVSGVSAPTPNLANNIGRSGGYSARLEPTCTRPVRPRAPALPPRLLPSDHRAGGTPSWMAGPWRASS